MDTTYELKLSDGRTLSVSSDDYQALSSASFNTGEHSRYVTVQPLDGRGGGGGAKLIVNADHVVTAHKLG